MENKFLNKLEKVLLPIGDKIGNQKHLAAISTGMMMTLSLIVVGSLFLIVANPPINVNLVNPETQNIILKFMLNWKKFAIENYAILTKPFNFTMGIVGLMTSFTIAYALSGNYNLNKSTSGLISMIIFLLVAAPIENNSIVMTYLGADGLFIAIILSLLTVEITMLIEKLDWKFKGEHIPPAVLSFMNALIPLLVNIIIIYGLSIVIFVYTGKDIPSLIMLILTPALTIGNNIWGYVAIVVFGNLLWLFGINGTSIIFPLVFSLGIANTGINAELIKSGQEPQMLMNLQMFRVAILGGAGNTIGLVILMMRSRSQQLKSIGKLSFIPGICGINEPVIFGTPIILNPILAIPFLFMPIVSLSLTYVAQKIDLISMGYIVDPSFAPFFIQGYLSSMDIRNLIFTIFIAGLSIVIYYPFFKIHEKHMLEIENSI
ncbi:PTS transporter subunit EIIC [Cetobacterium somerae]|uniref:PTS sugar transporter subunit IIC n=1 Tax=Cetobacterium sp. NK01 TaxID=2993530 RepID=UPI0021167D68|nr:PTS transporter subunit EIIC [Cetobacterium sp. NK01]MCQ8213498.1 PTS transporter subunit EIIC [Cetobacterium sp. NK01]